MGFNGELVFGRSTGPLLGMPVFAGVREEAEGRLSSWPERPGGWQTVEFGFGVLADPDGVLEAVVGWTRSPACWVSVGDSDAAVLTAMSPDGARWEVCLNPEKAAGMWAQPPEDVEDTSEWVVSPAFAEAVSLRRAELDAEVPDAARSALTWAVTAGFGTGVEIAAIEEILRSDGIFVEEVFSHLLDALGFPAPVGEP